MITSQRITELKELIAKEQELSRSKAQYEVQGLVYAGSMPLAKARLELKNAAMLELPKLLDEIEKLRKAGDMLAEYVELLARKGDDITTSELEAAIHAMADWKVMKGDEK